MTASKKAIQLNTVFMGTAYFAGVILKALIENGYNIKMVVTKPENKYGDKEGSEDNPVKALAEKAQLPLFQPEKMDLEAIDKIKSVKPDLILVASYGKILPASVLKIPGFNCINVHASLLPKFRGPSPIQNALLAGEKETGVAVMLMNEKMDEGDILKMVSLPIDPEDNSETLHKKMADLGAKTLLETLPLWVERKIEPQPQDSAQATLCQLIDREDGHIVWEDEAENIHNRYRALYPWPGIFSFWDNKGTLLRLKLLKTGIQKEQPEIPHAIGEIFQLGEKIGVQTIKGVIFLEEVQLEGKKPASIKEFINGYPSFIGSRLK